MRIASLLASATELVCALGRGDALVARSHECDAPEWVTRLPCVTRATIDVSGSSRAIDEQVRAKILAGAPLFEVDEAALLALRPDVILTQTHCEVCAVSGAPASLCRTQVASLSAGTLDGILAGFLAVARAIDRPSEGETLVARIRERLARLAAKTAGLARPRVACLEWLDPVFAMGNWGPELVALAGGECVLGTAGAHSATTPWEAVLEADPDVLVIAPCGFDVARTTKELHVVTERAGYRDLRAVRAGRVYVADGNRYFNRSGPTAFETAELLAEILHPREFAPAHAGRVWRAMGATA